MPRTFNRRMSMQNSRRKSKHMDRVSKLEQEFKDKLKAMKLKPAVNTLRDINMTQAQKSTLQLVLFKLLLIGTDKAVSKAKEYSKRYGISLDSKKNPSKARKVGSRRLKRGQTKKNKKPLIGKINEKVRADGDYYKPSASDLGQSEIALSLRKPY